MTSAKSSVFGFPSYLSFLWRSPHRGADSWCAGVPGVVGWVGGGVRRAYKADVSPWCNSGTWSGGAYVRMRAEDIVSIVQLKIKMFLKVNVFLADRIGRVDFSLGMLVNMYMNFIFCFYLGTDLAFAAYFGIWMGTFLKHCTDIAMEPSLFSPYL